MDGVDVVRWISMVVMTWIDGLGSLSGFVLIDLAIWIVSFVIVAAAAVAIVVAVVGTLVMIGGAISDSFRNPKPIPPRSERTWAGWFAGREDYSPWELPQPWRAVLIVAMVSATIGILLLR